MLEQLFILLMLFMGLKSVNSATLYCTCMSGLFSGQCIAKKGMLFGAFSNLNFLLEPKSKNFSITYTSGTNVLTLNGIDYCFPPLKFIKISEFISIATLEQKFNLNLFKFKIF